jgi:hypothetical protein
VHYEINEAPRSTRGASCRVFWRRRINHFCVPSKIEFVSAGALGRVTKKRPFLKSSIELYDY